MMTCGVFTEDKNEIIEFEANDLVIGHSYSLIACAEVEDPKGSKAQLVRIRNPWGDFKWTGDWHDESDLWTQQAREAIGHTDDDTDGTFCMELSDFKKYFRYVYICKY